MTFNRAVVSGEIIGEPEARYTNNEEKVTRILIRTGSNTNLSLACWGNAADVAENMKVGESILASGNLVTSSYKTAQGNMKKDFELTVRELFSLPSAPQSPFKQAGFNQPPPQSSKAAKPKGQKTEDLSEIFENEDEEELPF